MNKRLHLEELRLLRFFDIQLKLQKCYFSYVMLYTFIG